MKKKKDGTTLCLPISYELRQKIFEMARNKNVTMSALIRIAISEYLERN